MAFWFAVASLWALVSAPTGILRALHRFDRAVYVEAIVPLGRLLAALWIWYSGPTVGRFLFAWAAIDLAEAEARSACRSNLNRGTVTQAQASFLPSHRWS